MTSSERSDGTESQQPEMPYSASIERAQGPETAAQASHPTAFAEMAALCPIGAFDSGLGGLSIINELRRLLPAEDVVYYADNANVPYGGRSHDWLRARSVEITEFLLDRGAKAILVACNTASAAGLEHLRARYDLPIVGLVPALKPAVAATRKRRVGVLATRATMRGQLLTDVIARFATPASVEVITVAPDELKLVEAVERGDLDTPQTAEAVKLALQPMLDRDVDAIVLGCTHYPFLRPLMQQVAGSGVQIIDSSEGVSRQTMRVLEARGLLRHDAHRGSLMVYTSGDPAFLGPLVSRLVGEDVSVLAGDTARTEINNSDMPAGATGLA